MFTFLSKNLSITQLFDLVWHNREQVASDISLISDSITIMYAIIMYIIAALLCQNPEWEASFDWRNSMQSAWVVYYYLCVIVALFWFKTDIMYFIIFLYIFVEGIEILYVVGYIRNKYYKIACPWQIESINPVDCHWP